ncbi:MAG: serine/threonine protein kinase, partial [Candidatus Obscuribacterales bacterium]|nr:serine/threonine protein kinase [Candidatus Obscuribacterales bacterium]
STQDKKVSHISMDIKQAKAELSRIDGLIASAEEPIYQRFWFMPKAKLYLLRSSILVAITVSLLPPIIQYNHLNGTHFLGHIQSYAFLALFFLLLITSPFYIFFGTNPLKDKVKLDPRRWPSAKGFAFLLAALGFNWLYETIFYLSRSDSMMSTLGIAALSAIAIFGSGALSYKLGSLIPSESSKPLSSNRRVRHLQTFAQRLLLTGKNFLTQSYPFLSVSLGFFVATLLVSFLPGGCGQALASWLTASFRDANLSNINDGLVDLIVESLTALAILLSLESMAVRLGATYQSFLKESGSQAGDGLTAALARTLKATTVRLALAPKHPHLRSAFESLLYLAACYLLLFGLFAFTPDILHLPGISANGLLSPAHGLSNAVRNWLYGSTVDAGFSKPFFYDTQFFMASYLAAIGLVPFAVMSCAFLPSRKPAHLSASTQGIILPNGSGRRLKFWNELKTVSGKNLNKRNEKVQLKFSSGTITLNSADHAPEKLAEVLALADEHGKDAKFDPDAIAIRRRLSKTSHTSSLAEAKNFESTIFKPYIAGDTIKDGTYRVVRKLMSKPLSAVYLVRTETGVLAVLKQFALPPGNPKAEQQKLSFMRECKILGQLQHPLIARITDSFEYGGSSFIALEHIDGIDLRQLVEDRGARKEEFVIRWALDLLEQLKYLHEQNPPLLHRDLSPDNLMLDELGKIRVIDFGAAQQFMEGVTGTLIGKQAYIAPEQLRGKASDIYSLGATLYFLLTGKDPRALKESDPAAEGIKVSKELAAIVKACTAFDESERPSSCEELISEFTKLSKKNSTSRKTNPGLAVKQTNKANLFETKNSPSKGKMGTAIKIDKQPEQLQSESNKRST